MASFSILIKNGMVARGKKLERLDVGIKGEKIEEVGDLSRAQAEIVIDAAGKYISPGFVDLTNHSDTHWTLFNQPSQESLLNQGITTILGGNCGSSIAPLVNAESIEGIQKWVDIRDINVNWRRVSEFFEELSRHPIGVNFATLVGHGTLRRGIIGDEARRAKRGELEEIKFLLEESLDDGAFGLSTSLGAAHGRPASENELAELFEVVSKKDGLTKHHLKDEGKNILPAISGLLELGRVSKVKMQFSHFKFLGRSAWSFFHDAIRMLEFAREEGLPITTDVFPYTKTGSQLYLLMPPWVLEGGKDRILEAIGKSDSRKEIITFLKSLTLHYENLIVASTLQDPTPVGKTIKDLSESSGFEPEELILQLLEANDLKISIFNEIISEAHIEDLIKKEYCMLASDGVGYKEGFISNFDLPHPRSFGSYPKAFEIFSKEKSILSWPELIYRMAELPALTLGLLGRGKVEKGYFADIVVIDPEAIESRSDYNNPYIRPSGIDWVLLNGEIAVDKGSFTGKLAGKILRRT